MSQVNSQPKSQIAALRDASGDLEQLREEWLKKPHEATALWQFDRVVNDTIYLIHTLDDVQAVKLGKRWIKLQLKLEMGTHWLNTVDVLRQSLPESDHARLAGAVQRLSKKPLEQCQKILSKSEWTRIRRWWYGYLDALPDRDPIDAIGIERAEKAFHRFSKLKIRVLKHDRFQDWLKLESAAGELRTCLVLRTPNAENARADIVGFSDIECHIRSWRRIATTLKILDILELTPEIEDDLNITERMSDLRLQQRLRAHKLQEKVRNLLTA